MSTETLPKVLCIHGAGSSGAIFRVQGRKIFSALRNEFQFVFVDAPFQSTAGPGMRPVFENSGPFYRWQCDMSASEAFDITEDEVKEESVKVRTYLENQLLKQDGGPFVGVMAFSQGARVATGLLMYLEKKRREGRTDFPDMKFAIVNSATYPPLYFDDGITASPGRLMIPSLHLQGSSDPWKPESEKMRQEFFSQASSTVIEFTGQHQVPIAQKDTDKVVTATRQLAAKALVEKP